VNTDQTTIQNAVVAVVPMSKDLGYRLQLEAGRAIFATGNSALKTHESHWKCGFYTGFRT